MTLIGIQINLYLTGKNTIQYLQNKQRCLSQFELDCMIIDLVSVLLRHHDNKDEGYWSWAQLGGRFLHRGSWFFVWELLPLACSRIQTKENSRSIVFSAQYLVFFGQRLLARIGTIRCIIMFLWLVKRVYNAVNRYLKIISN